jgi:hypothetical protein
MGHTNIETTRRIYAGDWREAEERNALVLRQLPRQESGSRPMDLPLQARPLGLRRAVGGDRPLLHVPVWASIGRGSRSLFRREPPC